MPSSTQDHPAVPPGPPLGPGTSPERSEAERARIPRSSHVALGAVMVAFLSAALVFTLEAPWEWWILPLAAAGVAAFVLRARLAEHRRATGRTS